MQITNHDDLDILTKFQNANKEVVAMTVKQWLQEEELALHDINSDKTDFYFAFKQGNINMNVGFYKKRKDSLIVSGNLEFGPQEQKMTRYARTKKELSYDIEKIFIQMNLDYVLKSNIIDGEFTVDDIILRKTIYFDGLSKDKFFDITSSIYNCFKILVGKLMLLGIQHQFV